MFPFSHPADLLLVPVHILSHQNLKKNTEQSKKCPQRITWNIKSNYLSFEDDVERVCLRSFSNDDIFVLVFHLKENMGHIATGHSLDAS